MWGQAMMCRCLYFWFGVCCLGLCRPAFAFLFALSFGRAVVSIHAGHQETLAFTSLTFAFAIASTFACAILLDI